MTNNSAIFIWIPKTAGTSIFQTLQEYGMIKIKTIHEPINNKENKYENHNLLTFAHSNILSVVEKKYISQEKFNNSFKFAFIRNPWDRFVSLFFYYKRMGHIDSSLDFNNFCYFIEKQKIDNITITNKTNYNHFNNQTKWILDTNETPIVDYIGRFESIVDDMNIIFDKLSIPMTKIKKLNGTSHKEYKTYYNNNTRKIIEKIYKNDIEYFGYGF